MTALKRTRYAEDQDGTICQLVDVRGKASPNSLLVWSYGHGKLVRLSYRYKNGKCLTRNETPDNQRWSAVSIPRWLRDQEKLYVLPELASVPTGFTLAKLGDTRTADQKRDDAERDLAQYVVAQQNKYRRLPGQRLNSHKADRFNGNIFA